MSQVAVGEQGVWVLSSSGGIHSLARLDPLTNQRADKGVDVGDGAAFITVGVGAVWVASHGGRLLKIDPKTERIVDRIAVGHNVADVSAGPGGLWVAEGSTKRVIRIDPRTDRPTMVASIPFEPSTLEAGEGAVWVSGGAPGASLARIDPRIGRATDTFSGLYLETVGSGSVWVAGPGAPNGAIRRLDPNTRRLAPEVYPTPITPVSVAASGGQVWIAKWVYYCKYHNPIPEGPPIVAWEVGRIDPKSLQTISTFTPLGSTVSTEDLSIGFGALWTPGTTDLIRSDFTNT